MPRPAREAIMTALFNALVASVQTSFTADTTANSVDLTNVSTSKGLFLGLPVFGGSIPRGAVIANLSPLALSQPPAANATAVPMSTGFLTTGRRVIPWGQVSSQPALFLGDSNEDTQYPSSILQALDIEAKILIYSNAGQNPNAVPSTALNNLLDAIYSVFTPDAPGTGRFTLGGLVHWCRIEGETLKDPGDTDGQAIALLPVRITVP
jgi:hypothetical protein